MKDLVIGMAVGYGWADVEPFAVSLVRSGFEGDKVLLVGGLTSEATKNLTDLGFILLSPHPLSYSDPSLPEGPNFGMTNRFLLIHKYLREHQGEYGFVFCCDVRDLVFSSDPSKWAHQNEVYGLIAASENILHRDQQHNVVWVKTGFLEAEDYVLDKPVYCAGFISGRAEYISDVCLSVYLTARHLSGAIWGIDQTAYNFVMHQKAYADITRVPSMVEGYCINLAVVACNRQSLTEPLASPIDLRDFAVIHQYDRIPSLAQFLKKEYSLPL